MNSDQYIIVRVTSDGKNYTWWEVERMENAPNEPLQALGNRTTSSSTLGTAVAAALPTLST